MLSTYHFPPLSPDLCAIWELMGLSKTIGQSICLFIHPSINLPACLFTYHLSMNELNIQKTKIMVSGSITSWQIDGEKVRTVIDFIFLVSKITVDYDCSHKIKWHLLLGGKAMTNLDSVWKSRDITLPTKVYIVKAMLLPVVMYRCESWTIKKAEHQRIDTF